MIDAVKPAVSDEMVELFGINFWPINAASKIDAQREHIRNALSAAIAAQGQEPVAVKALEWIEHGDLDFVWHRATPPIGYRYNIEHDAFTEKPLHVAVGQLSLGHFHTLEEAKVAAQADYETRIRSALTAPAQPVGVPVGYVSAVELYTLQQTDTCVDLFSTPPQDGFQFVPVYAAPQPPAEDGWRDIASAPKNKKILAAYRNDLGKWRIVTACYHTQLDWSDEYGDHEQEFAPEAWYEENESSEVIYPTSNPPSHWMPLPPAPANGGEQ